MAKPVTYISIDIEANGPIPGPYSMLALGSVAWTEKGVDIDSFSANLMPLDGAGEDPSVMKFWGENPAAWQKIRVDLQEPLGAMKSYTEWLASFKSQVIAITRPKGYDFLWVYWYLRRFAERCPFGWEAIDLRSFIAGQRKMSYKNAIKANLPKEWFEGMRHSHVPVEDAREIGELWWKVIGKKKQETPQPAQPVVENTYGDWVDRIRAQPLPGRVGGVNVNVPLQAQRRLERAAQQNMEWPGAQNAYNAIEVNARLQAQQVVPPTAPRWLNVQWDAAGNTYELYEPANTVR